MRNPINHRPLKKPQSNEEMDLLTSSYIQIEECQSAMGIPREVKVNLARGSIVPERTHIWDAT